MRCETYLLLGGRSLRLLHGLLLGGDLLLLRGLLGLRGELVRGLDRDKDPGFCRIRGRKRPIALLVVRCRGLDIRISEKGRRVSDRQTSSIPLTDSPLQGGLQDVLLDFLLRMVNRLGVCERVH